MTNNIYCNSITCNSILLPTQSKFCCLSCSTKERNRLNRQSKMELYSQQPSKCKNCDASLSYDKKENDFCSKSCSVSYNNRKKDYKKSTVISICSYCKKTFNYYPSSSTGKFCSPTCNGLYKKSKSKIKFENGLLFERSTIKQFVIERDTYKCSSCNISEWMNNPISLHLDHIDGDSSNNFPNNFRLLCPNCHSQTPTYGSKNKGNGRKSKGLPIR